MGEGTMSPEEWEIFLRRDLGAAWADFFGRPDEVPAPLSAKPPPAAAALDDGDA